MPAAILECPQCQYDATVLGTLGRTTHYRCRACGWQFSRTARAPRRWPGKQFHLVTRDLGDSYSVLHAGTRRSCFRYARGRWGHMPGFAAVTTRTRDFHKCRF